MTSQTTERAIPERRQLDGSRLMSESVASRMHGVAGERICWSMRPFSTAGLLLFAACSTQATIDDELPTDTIVQGAVQSDVSLLAWRPGAGLAPTTKVLVGLLYTKDLGTDLETDNSSFVDTFTSRNPALRTPFKSSFQHYRYGSTVRSPDGGVVTDSHPNCPRVTAPTLIVNGYAKPYEFAQSEFLSWLSRETGRTDFLPARARVGNPFRGNQECPLTTRDTTLRRSFGQKIAATSTSVTLTTDNTVNPWRWAAPINEVHHHEQPSLYATFPARDRAAIDETRSILAAALAGDLSRRIILEYDLDVTLQDGGLGAEPNLFSIFDSPDAGAVDLFEAQYQNTMRAWLPHEGPRRYLEARVIPPSFQLSVGVNFRENDAGYRLSEFQLLGHRYAPALVWGDPSVNTDINRFTTEGGGSGVSAWTRLQASALALQELAASGGPIVRSGVTYTELATPSFTGKLKGQLDVTQYYRVSHGHKFFPGLADGGLPDENTARNEIAWAGVVYEAHGPLKVTVKINTFNLRVERTVHGACGTTANTCTAGTFVDVADSTASVLWTCAGLGGGTTASCSSPKPALNGACGATLNACTAGTFADQPDTATTSLWSCVGVNGGTTAPCSLAKPLSWVSVSRTTNGLDHDIAYPGYLGAGFAVEGVVFRAATTQGSGMHALYNCRIGTNHFVSPSSTCEGQQVVSTGPIGFVFTNAGAGRAPVYRCNVGGDHYVSGSATCEVGVAAEGVLGYFL